MLLDWKSAYRDNRKEEVIIARLRTGTPYFKIKHHIDANTQVESCNICNVRMNIYHLFLVCPQYSNHRQGILAYLNSKGISNSLNSILNDKFPGNLLIKFLKNTNFYNKI